MMKLIGALVVLGGWLVTLTGLLNSTTITGRGGFAVLGIAISLFGIFGIINREFLKTANWKH